MTEKADIVYRRADPYTSTKTIESRLRIRRFAIFRPMLEAALQEKEIIEIVDLGGTETYWNIAAEFLQTHKGRVRITLVNLEPTEVADHTLFRSVVGDVCDPTLFEDYEFDFVHSNSVIEHVGDWARIEQFAYNVLRLGKRHYVQTPNYWFPIEPHFRMPAFQWLPVPLRTWMLTRLNLGFYSREPEWSGADDVIRSINLLDRRQVEQLFAGSDVRHEWLLGLPKSVLAMGESYKSTHLTTIRHDRRPANLTGLVPTLADSRQDQPAMKSSTA